jgi:hypothetical protein
MQNTVKTGGGGSLSGRLADLGCALLAIAEELDVAEQQQRPVDQERWMRGARKELAELIRGVEGPNPHRG